MREKRRSGEIPDEIGSPVEMAKNQQLARGDYCSRVVIFINTTIIVLMCIFSGDDDALRKVILYLILLYIARGQLVSRMQASRLLVRAFDRPTDTFFVLFSFAEILAMRSFSRWAAELGSATHHRQGGRQWTCSLSGQNRLIDPLR